jgi:hypothetical protein
MRARQGFRHTHLGYLIYPAGVRLSCGLTTDRSSKVVAYQGISVCVES